MKKIVLGGLIAATLGLGAFAASAADLKSLRGDNPIDALDQAPPVFSVQESGKIERSFRQQPPMVPHVTEKYQVDLKVNQCLNCHDWTTAAKEKAPEAPKSHYQDREGNEYEVVNGGRWFCTQCHAPVTDAAPLVGNDFEASR